MKSPLKPSNVIIAASVALGLLAGALDVFVDALVFGEGSILDQLLRPSPFEWYIRGSMLTLAVVIGVFVLRITERLEKAVEEVRTLRGLLSTCSSCKRIQKDDRSWVSLEDYVLHNTDTQFSHAVCPDCQEKLYGRRFTD